MNPLNELKYCNRAFITLTHSLNKLIHLNQSNMDKQPVFISIANQKGGIGKSTYTIFTASLLHYRMGYRVLVADCDYPQWSIARQRERDLDVMESSERLKQQMMTQYKQTGQKVWPVLETQPSSALADISNYIRQEEVPDVVLVDFPGTIGTKGVLGLMACMDYLFVPVRADKTVLESSITFARTINEGIIARKSSPLKSVSMFWTMLDRRERTPLYEHYEQVIRHFGLSLMRSRLPMRSRFSRESDGNGGIFRSTLFAADRSFTVDSGMDDFLAELCAIAKLE